MSAAAAIGEHVRLAGYALAGVQVHPGRGPGRGRRGVGASPRGRRLPDPHARPRTRRSPRASPSVPSSCGRWWRAVSLEHCARCAARRGPSPGAGDRSPRPRPRRASSVEPARRQADALVAAARAQGEADGRLEAAREEAVARFSARMTRARRAARVLRRAAPARPRRRPRRCATRPTTPSCSSAWPPPRAATSATTRSCRSTRPISAACAARPGPARSTTRWRPWPTAASTTSARGSRRCGRDGAHRDPRQRAGRRDRRHGRSASARARRGRPQAAGRRGHLAARGRARSCSCTSTRAGSGRARRRRWAAARSRAELGPGLLGGIFDGMLRRLEDLGERLPPGARAPTLSRDRRWHFTPARARGRWRRRRCRAGERPRDRGDRGAGAGAAGRRRHRRVAGGRRASTRSAEPIARIAGRDVRLAQPWPLRRPRPSGLRLDASVPLSTGQRSLDLLFPVARGSTAAVPGGFGTGKTVLLQQIAKWCGRRRDRLRQLRRARQRAGRRPARDHHPRGPAHGPVAAGPHGAGGQHVEHAAHGARGQRARRRHGGRAVPRHGLRRAA